jgi:hypothetical protein
MGRVGGGRKTPWSTFKKVLHPILFGRMPSSAIDGLNLFNKKKIVRERNDYLTRGVI